MLISAEKLLVWMENSEQAKGFWGEGKPVTSFDELTDEINNGTFAAETSMSMETTQYIEKLVSDMDSDSNWNIVGIVEVEEFTKDGITFGKVNDKVETYEKQGNEFIRQWAGHLGDDFHGFLLKPLAGN